MIEASRNERVVHLAIHAPPVNVLDTATMAELTERLRDLASDDGLAAVVLRGEGKCFSAGASVAEHRPPQAAAMVRGLLEACTALADLPVPAVALVHGACLGGAMELISFCDFVVADPSAKLGQPEIKLAFFPPVAVYQLPRLSGLQNAAWTVFSGETLDAERALVMGFVQKILPVDDWGRIDAMLNGSSAPVLRLTKRALNIGAGEYRRERLEQIEQLFLGELYELDDVEEGIRSFEERRKPEWRHR
jgi:cyclohexa-1,5-dienecarbonyl-CoA hydratase